METLVKQHRDFRHGVCRPIRVGEDLGGSAIGARLWLWEPRRDMMMYGVG